MLDAVFNALQNWCFVLAISIHYQISIRVIISYSLYIEKDQRSLTPSTNILWWILQHQQLWQYVFLGLKNCRAVRHSNFSVSALISHERQCLPIFFFMKCQQTGALRYTNPKCVSIYVDGFLRLMYFLQIPSNIQYFVTQQYRYYVVLPPTLLIAQTLQSRLFATDVHIKQRDQQLLLLNMKPKINNYMRSASTHCIYRTFSCR